MHTVLATLVASSCLGSALAQSLPAPCFETNLGIFVGFADDFVFPAVTLNAPFSLFGTNYTQIQISSNGYVWMGGTPNTINGCCAGSGAALVAGQPRICALWTDLITDNVSGAGIYFNSLPGRDVITWKDCREFGTVAPRFTIQLQLVTGGGFTVWYSGATGTTQAFHSMVCGTSPGNNAANPGSTDLSASFPFNSGAQPTVYEEWPGTTFDLSARTFEFVANGNGGWLVLDRSACVIPPSAAWNVFGQGCPAASGIFGPSFYELFPTTTFDLNNQNIELFPLGPTGYLVNPGGTFFTGFTNIVPQGDDTVVQLPLPFPFPHARGTCTTAGFCSNGFVWLDNVSTGASFTPTSTQFLSGGARVAPAWSDYIFTSSGNCFFDTTPTDAYFTWNNAPEFGGAGISTFQLQLHSDGRMTFCYQTVGQLSHQVLSGWSGGNQTVDPGPIDISASMPFLTGLGVRPLVMSSNALPRLGSTFPLQLTDMAPAAVAGFVVLGFTQFNPGLPLDPLGMPGCNQFVAPLANLFFAATPPTQTVSLVVIPNNAALGGVLVQVQTAVFAPGINTLGVEASNGGTMRLGL
ncbi:MAG TPA: hypothetical protein VK348_12785 [Planctomycetota bacterium]|nr:hypothetical protein [Planctomycetota bacterium]